MCAHKKTKYRCYQCLCTGDGCQVEQVYMTILLFTSRLSLNTKLFWSIKEKPSYGVGAAPCSWHVGGVSKHFPRLLAETVSFLKTY